MDRKLYSTWMTIAALVLGLVGLAMILVSILIPAREPSR